MARDKSLAKPNPQQAIESAFHVIWEALASHPDQQLSTQAIQALGEAHHQLVQLITGSEVLQAQLDEMRANWQAALIRLDEVHVDQRDMLASQISSVYNMPKSAAELLVHIVVDGTELYEFEHNDEPQQMLISIQALEAVRFALETSADEIADFLEIVSEHHDD